MFYKRIILLLLVLCSLTGCANFNTDLDELYSKTYTVRFWGKGPDGRKKLSLLEDPSIDINSLTVYHEDYPNRKITQFHSGDKITIYYKDSNFKEIAKCTVNKAESVAIYFEIYHKMEYMYYNISVLDKNFKYKIKNYGDFLGTTFLDGSVAVYVFGADTTADFVCFATYQEDEIVDNLVTIYAIYEVPIYYI